MAVSLTVSRRTRRAARGARSRIRAHLDGDLAVGSRARCSDPRAAQPDVLLVDVRQQRSVTATLPALKRQHPATKVDAARLVARPGVDARGDARGCQRVLAEPLTSGRLRCGDYPSARSAQAASVGGPVFAFVGAKGGVGTTTMAVNVATALAKLVEGPDAAHRPAPGLRRCGRLPRRRCAILAARRAREHAPARRRVPEEPGRQDQLRPRPAGVRGSSGQPRQSTCGGSARSCSSRAAQLRATPSSTSPLRPRPCSTASISVTNLVVVANQELADGPQRGTHGGGAAVPVSERRRSRRSSTGAIDNAEIGQRDVEKAVGGTHRAPVSQ